MPKLGQSKGRKQQVELIEQFIYSFEIQTVYNEDFSHWLGFELENVHQWNKDIVFHHPSSVGFGTFHMNGYWRVYCMENYKIKIECNSKLFSFRKNLKVNAIKQSLTIL